MGVVGLGVVPALVGYYPKPKGEQRSSLLCRAVDRA